MQEPSNACAAPASLIPASSLVGRMDILNYTVWEGIRESVFETPVLVLDFRVSAVIWTRQNQQLNYVLMKAENIFIQITLPYHSSILDKESFDSTDEAVLVNLEGSFIMS